MRLITTLWECQGGVADILEAKRRHIVLTYGKLRPTRTPVRLHSACFTSHVLRSCHCDCRAQYDAALDHIIEYGYGLLVYLRGPSHEGRGIGLAEKLKTYYLQHVNFMDTVDANKHIGFGVDLRDFSDAAAIVRSLGLSEICLLTNNPKKIEAMVTLTGVVKPLRTAITKWNARYLKCKRDRLGHNL